MIRTNSIHFAIAVGAIAVASTGCGRLIERATEEAVEQALESEGGEDVEIDFSDGEIRVESDEGDVTFSADENGVQIDGTDADGNDFSVNADENGLEVESEDGTSLDIDDDGTFVATDENGEVITGEADGDGGFTVEDSDGDAVFSSSDEIPEQWPTDVPEPEGLSDVTGTYFSEGDDQSIIITGTTSGDLRDIFESYTGELEDAGFDEESTFTQGDDAASSTYVRGDQRISVSIQSLGDTAEMVIALN
jgi:hypothetical protein